MEGFEGIKFTLSHEYLNEDAILRFTKNVEAARKASESFQSASKKVRGAQRTAARTDGQKEAVEDARAVAKAQKEVEKQVRRILRHYKAQAGFARETQRGAENRLAAAQKELDIANSKLAQERAARTLAAEADKQSLRARTAEARLATEQNKQERRKVALLRQQQEFNARNLTPQANKTLQTILRKNQLLGDEGRILKDTLAIQQQLLAADRARQNLARPGRTKLENTVDNAAIRRSGARIQGILSKNLLDNERALLKTQTQRQREQARALKESIAAQRKLFELRQRQESLERASNRIQRMRAENALLEGTLRGRRALLSAEREIIRIENLRTRARDTANPVERAELQAEVRQRRAALNNALAAETTRTVAAQERLNRGVEQGSKLFDRLAGTVRGVVVGLLVYRGITRGSQLFGQLIRDAVTFGAELEVSQAAIAGLVSGSGDLIDSQGRVLQGAEKFAAAMGLAKSQLAALQDEAIGTSSTFQDLQRNFQLNVTQGLLSGLNINEFREVTKLFSQGATLFGLPQNQLAEEIRSVLQGTIRARDTRIAVALGITNEDIGRAREAGKLFEFLQERFRGVSEASAEISSSLPVILSDIQDAFQFSAASGGTGLRQELTALSQEIKDSLTLDDGTLDPQVAERFAKVFEPLRRVVAGLRGETGPLSQIFFDVTESLTRLVEVGANVGRVLAPSLLLATQAFSGFLSGIISVVNVASTTLRWFAQLGRSVANLGASGKDTSISLEGLGRVVGLLVGTALLAKLSLLVTSSAVGIVNMAKSAGTLAVAIGRASKATGGFLLKLGIGLALISVATAAVGGLAGAVDTDLGKSVDGLVERFTSVEAVGAALEPLVGVVSSASQVLEGAFDGVRLNVDTANSDAVVEFTEALLGLREAAESFSSLGLSGGIGGALAGALDQNLQVSRALTRELELQEIAIRGRSSEAAEAQQTNQEATKSLREQLRLAEQREKSALRARDAVADLDPPSRREETFLLERALAREGGVEFDAFESTSVLEDAQRAYNKALVDTSVLKEKLSEADKAITEATLDQRQAERELVKLGELRARNLREQAETWAVQLRAIAEANRLQVEQDSRRIAFDRGTVQQELGLGTDLASQRAREQRQLELESEEILDRRLTLQKELNDLQTTIAGQRDVFANAGYTDAGQVANDIAVLSLQEENLRNAIAGTNEELLLNNKLRQEQARIDSFGRGFQTAVENRQRGVTNAAIGEGVTNAGLDFVQQTPTALFTEALRSAAYATEPDFARIFADAGIQLGAQLGQAFFDKFLIQPLTGLFVDSPDPVEIQNNLLLAANTKALFANTIALKFASVGGSLGPAFGPGSAAATGLFSIFAKGGPVGFDSGGPAERRTVALPGPVPGYDSRDRLLGLMRPGEFVVTPEMMFRDPSLLPHLSMLRRAAHFGAGLPDFSRLRKPPGFAAGGPVGMGESSASAGGGASRVSRMNYQPVLVVDGKLARRINGDPSFAVGLGKRTNRRAARLYD